MRIWEVKLDGLDKKGKEIHLGDVVLVGEMKRQVVFMNGKLQLTGLDAQHNAFYDVYPTNELEVIGNM